MQLEYNTCRVSSNWVELGIFVHAHKRSTTWLVSIYMSLFPSLSRVDRRTAPRSAPEGKKKAPQVHLPNIPGRSSSHGNEVTPLTQLVGSSAAATQKGSNTAMTSLPALPTHNMTFTEAVRQESLPIKPCSRCGLEYGASSMVLHQQNCTSQNSKAQSSKRTTSEGRRNLHRQPFTIETAPIEKERTSCSVFLNQFGEPLGRERQYGFPCQFCGERFGRHSLHLHQNKCRQSNTCHSTGGSKPNSNHQISSTVNNPENPILRQPIETEAPGSRRGPILFDLPPRPKTRTLEHSLLVQNGYTLPIIEDTCTKAATYGSPKGRVPSEKKTIRRPPTVVCYICGREYGSKSISIHEPQCLKKFELENRKLPISERKPLPKKPINHPAIVVAVTSQELIHPAGVYRTDLLQETADQYFQYCYSEWERDLIPCKTCGRKFAPERHVKHAHRCKAKPLPNNLLPRCIKK